MLLSESLHIMKVFTIGNTKLVKGGPKGYMRGMRPPQKSVHVLVIANKVCKTDIRGKRSVHVQTVIVTWPKFRQEIFLLIFY